VDLGGGRQGDERFGHQGYRGGVTIGLVPRLLHGEIEGQYVRLANVSERALRLGAIVQPFAGGASRANYHRSISEGNVWQHVTARHDVRFGAIGLLGGFAIGGSTAAGADRAAWQTASATTREVFAGGSVTLKQFETIGTVAVAHQPGGRVDRLTVALRVPMGSKRRSESNRELRPIDR
jgi:hypothetical protein